MSSGALKVKVSIAEDDIVLIKIDGELTIFTEEYDMLHKEIGAYIKMGLYKFIVDLRGVTYIDSSGLGLIIRLATHAFKQNSRVCIMYDGPQVEKLLFVSNIDKIVQIVPSPEEGYKFFRESGQE
ncbi:STAS domain-containing protein [Thermospira aquatica]|uniref:STAS domain-containing protein n=1 Tax=Thermospira aquatica TaxID=2828656 RepID=A0AAX3BCV1_9SPIR|nr:STAS domain-containing protein [Thermospira aquatica]URA10103.1 STAS domain-containing protein [Thermospira aquatica]